jgi:universal stress protein F
MAASPSIEGHDEPMHRLLVGLDASPRSEGVLHAAIALAQKTHGELVLFRAVGLPPALPADACELPPNEVAPLLEHEADGYLARCLAKVPEGLQARTLTHVGTPWQALCDAATEEACDLIVIGSHGYRGIDRLRGTTAAKVVNHAAQSVLVVRSADVVDDDDA